MNSLASAVPYGPILNLYPDSLGSSLWSIQLVEQIPAGSPEAEELDGEFTLKIVTDQKTELYSGCRWASVKREFNKQGLQRTRKGYALLREEE